MTRRAVWQRAGMLALLPLFMACSSLVPRSSSGVQATTVSTAAGESRTLHESLDLAGRLSVHYQGPRQPEALHGSFTWVQTPTKTTVALLSPLGQTIAVINATPEGATLTQSGQPVRAAADVDSLTAETLGWPLPVAGLRDWLQGFAIDSSGKHFVATPQSSEVTTHDGWHISYANWQEQDAAASQNFPKRIDLARSTEQAGDVSIRIVIDSWQIP